MGIMRKMKRNEEKEQADQISKETKKNVGEWVRKVIQSGKDYADDKHREHVAQAQYRIQSDLMEVCGVGEPSQIDYDNPHVKILLLNCDPVNQRLLVNPKLRHIVYEKMDAET